MRDIDLKSLRLLVAVCDLQNMKRAAAQEHIEPSAISKRIAQLEERRSARRCCSPQRGVQPTPAGIALLEHARTCCSRSIASKPTSPHFSAASRATSAGGQRVGHRRACWTTSPTSCASRRQSEHQGGHRGAPVRDLVRASATEAGLARRVLGHRGPSRACKTPGLSRTGSALAVHAEHPLAGRASLRFAQTLEQEHVGLPPQRGAHHAAARRGPCRAEGVATASSCRTSTPPFARWQPTSASA